MTRSSKGELGRKTGKGFYDWKDGKAVKVSRPPVQPTDRNDRPSDPADVECLRRLPARRHCRQRAIVVDGAMIFGTGYAPFRGGPLNYARTRGQRERCRPHCSALEAKFSGGGRFKPDTGWDSFA